MYTQLTKPLIARLREAGVECFLAPGHRLPTAAVFEPPCSVKWMAAEVGLTIGAFSYAVSGNYINVIIGRYTSIGEAVQMRGSHPTGFVSTSPAFYLPQKLFNVGGGFEGSEQYAVFKAKPRPSAMPPKLQPTRIGNDVYIGHNAYIRPGITIGDGAVIGAHAVVVKDVPPYAVVAGNPAVIKKFRVPPRIIGALLSLQWWRYAPWQLAEVDMTNPETAVRPMRALFATLKPYAPATFTLAELAAAPVAT
jgi:chloramphenicol O-acetyltransferase type B